MERKPYFVCQKCKDLQKEPLVLHIFEDHNCTTLLDVCKKCHTKYMDNMKLAADKA